MGELACREIKIDTDIMLIVIVKIFKLNIWTKYPSNSYLMVKTRRHFNVF